MELWLRISNSLSWLHVDAVTTNGQPGSNSWWRPPSLSATWAKEAWPIGNISSNVVHAVASLLFSCKTEMVTPKVYFDQLKLVRTNGPGGAYAFDGVDDYIEIPDSPSLALTNAITVEAWIYPKGQASNPGYIASKYVWEDGWRSWLFFMDQGDHLLCAQVWASNGQSNGLYSPAPLSLNIWHHVAFTFNASLLQMYIDGSLVASRTVAINNIARTTAPVRVGDNPQSSTGTNAFYGLIGDVRLYNRALSAMQIHQRWLDMATGAADSGVLVNQETAAGETWSVQITPSDGIVDGAQTNTASLTLLPTPSNLWASHEVGQGAIWVTWDLVPGATNYLVWRSSQGDDPATASLLCAACATNFFQDMNQVDCLTNYYYWVAAQSSNAFSWRSASANGSANCAPVISSVSLASSMGTYYVVETMLAQTIWSDTDNSQVALIYNWLINTQEIAVAILPFETPGTNITRDYTSFHNDGFLHGAPQWKASAFGGPGGAYELDGTNDFIEIPDSDGLDLTNNLTIEAWIYPYGQGSHDGLVAGKGLCSPGTDSWRLLVQTNGLLVQIYDDTGASDNLFYAKALTTNAWHHVVVEFQATVGNAPLRLYVDGSYVTNKQTSVTNIAVTSAPIRIGADPECGDVGFHGLVGDFRIYRRVLSMSQIITRWLSMRVGKADCRSLLGQEAGVGTNMQVRVTASDGIVDSQEKASNEVTLLSASPAFVHGPCDQAVPAGGTVVLSVETTGMLPMGYKWRLGGANVFWELRSNNITFLLLTNVTAGQAGTYTVLATNLYSPVGVGSPPGVLTVDYDSDHDGMPDSWETLYKFSPNDDSDAAQDADGDGFTNLQEYWAGTNPTNQASFLELTISAEETGAAVKLQFSAAPAKTYSILFADDPASTVWQKCLDIAATTNGGPVAITNQLQTAGPRFYRLCTPARLSN